MKKTLSSFYRHFFLPMDGRDFSLSRMAFYGILLLYGLRWELIFYNKSTYFNGLTAKLWKPIGFFSWGPYFSISSDVATVLHAIWVLGLICCVIGFCWRITSKLTFVLTLFLFGYIECFGKIFNDYHLVVFFMGILCLVRCPGSWSLDQLISKLFERHQWNAGFSGWFFPQSPSKSGEYQWAIRTALFYLCLVYFCAASQKLRTSGVDWFASDNLRTILLTRHYAIPAFGKWVSQFSLLPKIMAFGVIFMQLFAFLAIFRFRFSWIFLFGCFWFHIVGEYFFVGADMAFTKHWLCFVLFVPRLFPWFLVLLFSGILWNGTDASYGTTLKIAIGISILTGMWTLRHGLKTFGDR